LFVGCHWSKFWGGSTPRLAYIVTVNGFFLEETEHVVEHIVTISLTSEEETLRKLPPGTTEVGHFADDKDCDATIGGRLGVNGVNEYFTVLETHGDNFVVNVLFKKRVRVRKSSAESENHQLTVARLPILSLNAVDEGGRFGVKTMQTVGLLVENGVVFCNKLPTNFRRVVIIVVHWRSCCIGHDEAVCVV
jgi:hypothetical protein